ncbi:MAG: DUF2384 domain-containing protein [Alphaproteobacteria bacterium]|nr:DUF2384 domain-containing protein [Alphaproteobacteria bacterium]
MSTRLKLVSQERRPIQTQEEGLQHIKEWLTHVFGGVTAEHENFLAESHPRLGWGTPASILDDEGGVQLVKSMMGPKLYVVT